MILLKGFMDHWVPSRDFISKFWKQDYDAAIRILDELREGIPFNHFTFYTKWYTNGIKSRLPYLYNHPEASNVKTDNEWGRRMIDHLQSKGISVGAMIQFLTYDKAGWEQELATGEFEIGHVAEADDPVRIADISNSLYQVRLGETIKEQLAEFPRLDFLFLEFEGLDWGDVQIVYRNWTRRRGMPKSKTFHYRAETEALCKRMGIPLSFLWSEEAREMLNYYYKLNLQAAKAAIDEMAFEGTVGIVLHAYGYEALIYPDILPDPDWWLLPWNYWVCERDSPEKEQRKAISKEYMIKWKLAGHKVCHIGDATIGREGLELDRKLAEIEEFHEFSLKIGLDGYIGMGNPVPDIGLKWIGVTDSHVLETGKLYRKLYGID